MNTVQQVLAWVSENWDVLAQAATLVVAALPTGADSGIFGRIANLLRLLPFVPRPNVGRRDPTGAVPTSYRPSGR